MIRTISKKSYITVETFYIPESAKPSTNRTLINYDELAPQSSPRVATSGARVALDVETRPDVVARAAQHPHGGRADDEGDGGETGARGDPAARAKDGEGGQDRRRPAEEAF